MTCRQLSIWTNEKKPSLSEEENLWEKEIATKKLTKTLNHQDNYDAFRQFYLSSCDKGKPDRWHRRSTAKLSDGHDIMEQATIQWALARQPQSRALAETAMILCKVLWRNFDGVDAAIPTNDGRFQSLDFMKKLRLMLFNEAEVDRDEDFCTRVLTQLELLISEE